MSKFNYDFATYNNTVPMITFLESLPVQERSLIYKNIQKLLECKNNNFKLSDKFSKPLEDGIFELKVKLQYTTSRSLYFYEKDEMIIFTNGFIKKTQKTPKKEINKAKAIRQGTKNDKCSKIF